LGIIGYGNVGSSLGILAEALSLKVIFYDVLANMPIGRAEPRTSMDQLLAESDFVSINVSTLQDNVGLIGEKELAKMKPNSYLINCSFGDAIDNEALAKYIQSGHIKGAAIDFHPYDDEPKSKKGSFKSVLQRLPNVILTPHIAKRTFEAEVNAAGEVQKSLVKFIVDGTTLGCVNFPSIVGWPLKSGCSRILCLHRNVRGVVREIQNILSTYNIDHQLLDTMDDVGILLVDVDAASVPAEIVSKMASLANAIRTRII
jgi:D-3-phosphoglycerate dehydrogenase